MHMKLVFKKLVSRQRTLFIFKRTIIRGGSAGPFTGFEHPVIEERVYPELIFKEPQSIIAIALAYPSKLKEAPVSKKGARRGVFARASWELITIPFCEKN